MQLLKDVAEIPSLKAESHVNGNNIATFTKTKNEDRKKEIFVSEEYFLTLLQVHYVTLVCFGFVLNQFFFFLHTELLMWPPFGVEPRK